MRTRFGWVDAHRGNRFLAPVSETTLLDAGRAAGLRAGSTLLEVGCGNGAATVLLAEAFHAYGRGIDGAAEWVAEASAHAARSPARARLRFLHGDPSHPDPGLGRVDCVLSLGGDVPVARTMVRPGGALVLGDYHVDASAPAGVAELFPHRGCEAGTAPAGGSAGGSGSAGAAWTHTATPLEWERFYAPQERALRALRGRMLPGDAVPPVAMVVDGRIGAFRAHAGKISYLVRVIVFEERS
jgi:SAM-dependent methyltransferase